MLSLKLNFQLNFNNINDKINSDILQFYESIYLVENIKNI